MAQESSSSARTTTIHLLGRNMACCFAELLPIQFYSMGETSWDLPTLIFARATSRQNQGSESFERAGFANIGSSMLKSLKFYIETEDSFSVTEAASDLLKDLFRLNSPFRFD
jgi:hypothetical protein